VNPQNDPVGKWFAFTAPLIVLPPWVWLAVRTKHCLEILTGRTIPIPSRTIWLTKVLALIIGGGGVLAVAVGVGIPWIFATFLGATVVFFALKERVQSAVPPKPTQNAAAYKAAWQSYWRLRRDFARSWVWFGVSGLGLILVTALSDMIPSTARIFAIGFCAVAVLLSIYAMTVKQLKWLRWPCPRCGCSFRGFWNRLWLPKRCAYCGLPRDDDAILNSAGSR
jgi:hypothetical protein